MFGIGTSEFLVILLVAVLVLGPEHLPRIVRTVTKVMSDFRRISTDFQRVLNLEATQEEWKSQQPAASTVKKKKKKKPVPVDPEADAPSASASAEMAGQVKEPKAPPADTPAAPAQSANEAGSSANAGAHAATASNGGSVPHTALNHDDAEIVPPAAPLAGTATTATPSAGQFSGSDIPLQGGRA